MSKSVCVIGAGVGGLTAAAYLAKEGYKVTVLEKAVTVGGSAGWYVRKKRKFPTGATIAFGLEEQGLLRTVLNDLAIDLPAEELLHPMDVVLPKGKVSLFKSPAVWEQELKRAFPDRSVEVLRFWSALQEISDDVFSVTESGVSLPIQRLYDLGHLPRYAVKHPRSMARLARYALYTVEDLMKKYNLESYEPLRQLLDAQLLDAVQTDVTEAALLPSSLALTIYRRGSFFIENGIGQLAKALATRIKELGGEVVVASPVKSLTYDRSDKEWKVDSRRCTSSFDVVINNSGVSLGQGTSYDETDEFSWGAFRVDAILSDAVRKGPMNDMDLPFAYQIVPKLESPALRENTHGPVYVTFHDTQDQKGNLVEGEVTMTVSLHTELERWSAFSKEEYKQVKEQVMEEILDEIEMIIPVKENIVFAEAGTPLTYERYVGKTAVGGFPLTVKNAIIKPKSVRSKLPGLYIVGEQVFPGPGTLSSTLSGCYAARSIMKG